MNSISKFVLCGFALLLVLTSPAVVFAQGANGGGDTLVMRGKPPMENVFYNVLWGSLAGGMGYLGLGTLDDTKTKAERNSFSNLTTNFFTGATYGGLFGLGAGVFFSLKNISFDANRSRIAFFQPTALPKPSAAGYKTSFEPLRLGLVQLKWGF